MNNIEYFEDLLVLDESDLDIACKTQAELFRMVGKKLVNAINDRDKIEHDLEVLSARKDEKIRRRAADTNEKITEAAIKNKIIMDKEVIELTDKYLEAQKEVNDYNNLQSSYIQRAKMIEEMGNFIRNQTYGELVIKNEKRKSYLNSYKEMRNNKIKKK